MRQVKRITIPTVTGILGVLFLIISGLFLEQKVNPVTVKAQVKPSSVKITNVSESSFTVSWLTEKPAAGSLQLNETNQLFFDVRDKGKESLDQYIIHYIDIIDLEPNKNYSFTILSAGETYRDEEFKVKTAPFLNNAKEADFAFGVVLNERKKPLPAVLVLLSIAPAQPLSALTNEKGHWFIPLNEAYKKDLSGLIDYDKENSIIEINLIADSHLSSNVITNTGNDHPLPPVVIGQFYDFSQAPPVPPQNMTDFQKQSGSSSQPQIIILDPDEGEIIFSIRPKIKGSAPAGEKVKIKIESEQVYEKEIIASSFGQWEWTSPELSEGEHTITVEYYDEEGILQKIQRNFIVRAAGNVSPSPTPIAALPTESLLSPIPTATIIPTIIPTVVATISPTLIPTISSTPIPSVSQPEKPITGSLTIYLILVSLGVGLIILPLFFSKKISF